MTYRSQARGGMRRLTIVLLACAVLCMTAGQAQAFFFPPFWPPSAPPPPPSVIVPPPPPVVMPPPPPVDLPPDTPPLTTENAPEPATLLTALLGSGLAGAFAMYRRKRRAAIAVENA